jgi:hypothetical protein
MSIEHFRLSRLFLILLREESAVPGVRRSDSVPLRARAHVREIGAERGGKRSFPRDFESFLSLT